MSISTTCYTYFLNVFDAVTGNSTDAATCDATLVTCTITTPQGNNVPVTCNSQIQTDPNSADPTSNRYFCVCGNNPLTVPSTVNCASLCYDLSTPFTCDFVTFYNGFNSGNSDLGIAGDVCDGLKCDQAGTVCTTDGSTSYQCDNQEHDLPGSSTQSYVCNCAAPAAIPSLYQSGGVTAGTACASGNPATGTAAGTTAAQTTAAASTAIATSSAGGGVTSSPGAGGTGSQSTGPTTAATSASSSGASMISLKRGVLGVSLLLMLRFAL